MKLKHVRSLATSVTSPCGERSDTRSRDPAEGALLGG
jgi:hypothetical protein